MRPDLYKEAPIIELESMDDLTPEKLKEYLKEDFIVLRNFETVAGFNKSLFTMANLEAKYGSHIIDYIK